MTKLFVSVSILVAFQGLLVAATTEEKVWVYNTAEDGYPPSQWQDGYPDCGGQHQSPIDIPVDQVKKDPSLDGLTLPNWDSKPAALSITNNGHSATVTVTGNFTVSGAGLPGVFKVVQFHFHWGSKNKQGSEHLIGGKAFPVEEHIVTYNTKYASFNEASTKPDGLAVIGVMLEVKGFGQAYHKKAFNTIKKQLSSIAQPDSSADVANSFTMNDILPAKLYPLYRYAGSLTTPGCYESVTWTILKNPLSVSRQFVKSLRRLIDSHGEPLEDNFRPVNPLHGREVTTFP